MKAIYPVTKERGETLSVLLERFKKTHPGVAKESLTYAGRLDPMAEGLVLILAGDMVHEKEEYLRLSKEYEVDILFGFATDTGDVLGELTETPGRRSLPSLDLMKLSGAVSGQIGHHSAPYPAFSSKPVDGVPLFAWARAGKLGDIEIPEHSFEITNITPIRLWKISTHELLEYVEEGVRKVSGDFRQERIIKLWEEHTRMLYDLSFDVATLRVECSSGAYMRSVAEAIGTTLGVPSLALRINRTRVGEYTAT